MIPSYVAVNWIVKENNNSSDNNNNNKKNEVFVAVSTFI